MPCVPNGSRAPGAVSEERAMHARLSRDPGAGGAIAVEGDRSPVDDLRCPACGEPIEPGTGVVFKGDQTWHGLCWTDAVMTVV